VGFELGTLHCKAAALRFEPHLPSMLHWLFWRWALRSDLPRLASNCRPPDLSLPSGWGYRREPRSPAKISLL
jgi:hypothetical protein